MVNENLGFRWMKVKEGRLHFATLELDIQRNNLKNVIVDNYLINGHDNNSEGMKTRKAGLLKGLEFALSNSFDFWTITIKKLEAPILDANPTIIGYTALLAFIEKTKIAVDSNDLDKIEHFVYKSWKNENASKIPNFYKLIFE
ncbi:hypothetical protein [Flavobacterium foetidum]|uniref:hypothetical protein n=1 Tax=Flavobacterium foetidum TaxID=2026681 RepID=UPI001074F8CC|nr:hypothetical protein [Flavobacterium foetidum]KAF2508808.1 hypothetical protein E0W73_19375 [Flavobacterium foetidum]